ncbi:MAG: hypothetical protein CMK50_02635 [Propionibacteriaceae bacterium]|nr:hypothetical protein [Propionibacteriaceae bacterium]
MKGTPHGGESGCWHCSGKHSTLHSDRWLDGAPGLFYDMAFWSWVVLEELAPRSFNFDRRVTPL